VKSTSSKQRQRARPSSKLSHRRWGSSMDGRDGDGDDNGDDCCNGCSNGCSNGDGDGDGDGDGERQRSPVRHLGSSTTMMKTVKECGLGEIAHHVIS
jgi:hypothetical protein